MTNYREILRMNNEFVGDLFWQGIRQFLAPPEAFQKLVDCGFPVPSGLGDFPAAHSIGEMEDKHSRVVQMRTSSKWIPLL